MKIKDNHKIKTSKMMDEFKKKFSTNVYWNNEELDKNFPAPKESTEREFKDEKEPEMLGKSYNQIYEEVGDRMMTFREYLIAFEQYYDKTGNYLDNKNITIFRDKLPGDEGVARGCWDVGGAQAEFYWLYRYNCIPRIGARVEISLNPSSSIPLTLSMSDLCILKSAKDIINKILQHYEK